ncbi:Ribonuclease PH [Enhygromyxa salina]|uniref:Ribonuclease PH n=1 Tax=Enhygromyxa salina TaxID=215803 RepID=A0A2S9XH26_9BACT|nr:ribonuclease PH [Enhygromyxa salina]PRP92178.1 Ribonuclease PH [Enhygromyxa salina]
MQEARPQRIDQRSPAQLRGLSLTPDFTAAALGSVLIATGRTRVLCTASLEPRTPKWLAHGGWITAEYAMLPGATSPRGRREASGRSKEIQRLIGRSLRAGVDLAKLVGPDGGLSIVCDCDVIEADGGTRTAAVTGAWVALEIALRKLVASDRLATHPGLGPVAAVSVGIVAPGGADGAEADPVAMLDLCYEEDSRAHVDLNVVMRGGRPGALSPDGRPGLVEVQGTGERGDFSRAQLDRMLDLAEAGIVELMAAQQAALNQVGV